MERDLVWDTNMATISLLWTPTILAAVMTTEILPQLLLISQSDWLICRGR